jgi:hypothetical protein
MGLGVKQLIALALVTSIVIVCYILPLVIDQAWWSLIALLPLLFLPVPWIFVPPRESFGSMGGSDDVDTSRHWAEFVTSFGALSVIAIPIVLWHVDLISWLDVCLSCAGTFFLVCSSVLFLYWQYQGADTYAFGFM